MCSDEECPDRNKSVLTHEVTEAATGWLDAHGFKPVETEVTLAKGWCADVACVIDPTPTELIQLKLIKRASKTAYGNYGEYPTWYVSIKPSLRLMTAALEVKTTRANFIRDKKKWQRESPVDLRFLAVPALLLRPDEYPGGWGILEVDTSVVRYRRVPEVVAMTAEQQRDVIFQIALRRDHHTRHERFRRLDKERRAEQIKEKVSSRLSTLVQATRAITDGKFESIEKCLAYYGVKTLPCVIDQLEPLYGIARR